MPTQLGKHFWPDFSFVSGIRIDYLSPTLYLTDLIIFALFIKTLLRREFKIEKLEPYILFLISLVLIGVLVSQNPLFGIYSLLKLLEMGFVVYYIYKKVNTTFLIKVLSIALLYESLIAILQVINKGSTNLFYFLGERTFNSQTPNIANAVVDGALVLRPYATLPHPNVLAGFLLITIFLIILFIKPRNTFERVYFYSCLFIGSITLILTLSRIPILLFLIFLPLILLKSKNYLSLLLIEGLAVLAALPWLSRFTTLSLYDQSLVERKNQIFSAIEMIKDFPLFGVGLGNFLNSLGSYYPIRTNYFFLQPVHNIYLLIISQVGILSSIIIGFLFLKLLKRTTLKLRIVWVVILILGFFDHYFLTLQQGQLLLAVLVGVSLRKD